MAKDVGKNLKDVERAMNRLRNKIKQPDNDYVVQISISSVDPGVIKYAASMTAPAQGLRPIAFIADNAEELITQIKVFTKEVNYDKIEIAYHKAQIEAGKRTIVGHEERIKDIEEGRGEGTPVDEVEETTDGNEEEVSQ